MSETHPARACRQERSTARSLIRTSAPFRALAVAARKAENHLISGIRFPRKACCRTRCICRPYPAFLASAEIRRRRESSFVGTFGAVSCHSTALPLVHALELMPVGALQGSQPISLTIKCRNLSCRKGNCRGKNRQELFRALHCRHLSLRAVSVLRTNQVSRFRRPQKRFARSATRRLVLEPRQDLIAIGIQTPQAAPDKAKIRT